jgi:hypothetical protein
MSIAKAVKIARMNWQSTHGLCSMCAVSDRPVGGLHRGQYPCPNERPCLACRGCLPPGEICRNCYRLNIHEYDA